MKFAFVGFTRGLLPETVTRDQVPVKGDIIVAKDPESKKRIKSQRFLVTEVAWMYDGAAVDAILHVEAE